jgi:hypothetical protein
VRNLTENEVEGGLVTGAAYVLFYKRRNPVNGAKGGKGGMGGDSKDSKGDDG